MNSATSNRVGIIGVGKLGLAYALCFEQAGMHVIASSYKPDYVTGLQCKRVDSVEPGIVDLLGQATNITFTTDNHTVIDTCDIIYIMVATPSTPNGDYDVSAVEQVAQDFLSHGSVKGKLVIIGSTVNPGTTARIQCLLQPLAVDVAYCPTFVAQGAVLDNIKNPHTVSVGTDESIVYERCCALFRKIMVPDTPIYRMAPLTAEILKLAGNCHSTMEISFFNMIGQMLINQGLERDLATANQYLNFVKRNTRWKFGFGYGGPCYPRDNRAMVHFANQHSMSYPLGELVDRFNQDHVDFLAGYLLKSNHDNLPFYFEYLSYKPKVSMFDESHQLKVCKRLLEHGATVWIQKTKFLPDYIVSDLSCEFKDQIFIVNDIKQPADVFAINF